MTSDSLFKNIKKVLIGGSRSLSDPTVFHKLSLTAFLAWVGLGADGLSSSAYGPEEAFLTLGTHHYLSLFVALATGITVIVISISYSQIIELFPSGGGGYLVASKLLSPKTGMVSGCALLIDYVLTITLSIASGTDALFSFVPMYLHIYKLPFAIFGLMVLIILNLRGVKESVVPLVPIFIAFVLLHVFAIGYAFISHLLNFGDVAVKTVTEIHNTQNQLGLWAMIILIVRAYTMGAGTYTGIEAVSNGIPILREPKVHTAKRTMKYMASSLAIMVIGILVAYILYEVRHVPGKTLNAVLFEGIVRNWDKGAGSIFLYAILISEAIILFVAAQTGFLDGPRVLANMAQDRWFPTRFAILSDRLVTQNGVLLMGGSALILMVLSHGSVKFLIVLYSINVFMTFFLSQLGMVRHWWQCRKTDKRWKRKISVNGIGLSLTTLILISVVMIKFYEGGWITIILTGSLVCVALSVKKHYNATYNMIRELDDAILPALTSSIYLLGDKPKSDNKVPEYDKDSKTAVILVNGFNGLGVHTLLSVVKTFSGTFKNFVFAQVGPVDAGVFKGTDEVTKLENKIKDDVDRYVKFLNQNGFYAESYSEINTEVVDGIIDLANNIFSKYPNSVFFGGQLVFPHETFFSKILHNQIVFSTQRRLYHQGIPFVILPIRILNV